VTAKPVEERGLELIYIDLFHAGHTPLNSHTHPL
jgi:hypothetical protein